MAGFDIFIRNVPKIVLDKKVKRSLIKLNICKRDEIQLWELMKAGVLFIQKEEVAMRDLKEFWEKLEQIAPNTNVEELASQLSEYLWDQDNREGPDPSVEQGEDRK